MSTEIPGVRLYCGKSVDVPPSVMQHAAVLHELGELHADRRAEAAAHVVGRVTGPDVRRELGLLVRPRLVALHAAGNRPVPPCPACGKMITSYFARRLPWRTRLSPK